MGSEDVGVSRRRAVVGVEGRASSGSLFRLKVSAVDVRRTTGPRRRRKVSFQNADRSSLYRADSGAPSSGGDDVSPTRSDPRPTENVAAFAPSSFSFSGAAASDGGRGHVPVMPPATRALRSASRAATGPSGPCRTPASGRSVRRGRVAPSSPPAEGRVGVVRPPLPNSLARTRARATAASVPAAAPAVRRRMAFPPGPNVPLFRGVLFSVRVDPRLPRTERRTAGPTAERPKFSGHGRVPVRASGRVTLS